MCKLFWSHTFTCISLLRLSINLTTLNETTESFKLDLFFPSKLFKLWTKENIYCLFFLGMWLQKCSCDFCHMCTKWKTPAAHLDPDPYFYASQHFDSFPHIFLDWSWWRVFVPKRNTCVQTMKPFLSKLQICRWVLSSRMLENSPAAVIVWEAVTFLNVFPQKNKLCFDIWGNGTIIFLHFNHERSFLWVGNFIFGRYKGNTWSLCVFVNNIPPS